MLRVVRGGLARGSRPNARLPVEHIDAWLDARDCVAENLSDDPATRRRELAVVLELCAAQSRGAFERSVTHAADCSEVGARRPGLTIGDAPQSRLSSDTVSGTSPIVIAAIKDRH